MDQREAQGEKKRRADARTRGIHRASPRTRWLPTTTNGTSMDRGLARIHSRTNRCRRPFHWTTRLSATGHAVTERGPLSGWDPPGHSARPSMPVPTGSRHNALCMWRTTDVSCRPPRYTWNTRAPVHAHGRPSLGIGTTTRQHGTQGQHAGCTSSIHVSTGTTRSGRPRRQQSSNTLDTWIRVSRSTRPPNASRIEWPWSTNARGASRSGPPQWFPMYTCAYGRKNAWGQKKGTEPRRTRQGEGRKKKRTKDERTRHRGRGEWKRTRALRGGGTEWTNNVSFSLVRKVCTRARRSQLSPVVPFLPECRGSPVVPFLLEFRGGPVDGDPFLGHP